MQRQAVSVANCPIKLKVCHPLCYWYKKGQCIFPPGGYDERGQRVRDPDSYSPAMLIAMIDTLEWVLGDTKRLPDFV